MPFGNKASPFLLNTTIRHLLDKFPDTKVIEELKENPYVDDWLAGADSDDEACKMFSEACDVMNQASMLLAKWNSQIVSDKIYKNFSAKHLISDVIKLLGMKWNPISDTFSFDGVDVPVVCFITKRMVLSCIARLFDPLGLLFDNLPYISEN